MNGVAIGAMVWRPSWYPVRRRQILPCGGRGERKRGELLELVAQGACTVRSVLSGCRASGFSVSGRFLIVYTFAK